eukprot:31058-Pelagococcus_subviridis.AAC.19
MMCELFFTRPPSVATLAFDRDPTSLASPPPRSLHLLRVLLEPHESTRGALARPTEPPPRAHRRRDVRARLRD